MRYDFGLGLVPAYQHVNPSGNLGGWVAETARVDSTVYVGINARVYGDARVCVGAQRLLDTREFVVSRLSVTTHKCETVL